MVTYPESDRDWRDRARLRVDVALGRRAFHAISNRAVDAADRQRVVEHLEGRRFAHRVENSHDGARRDVVVAREAAAVAHDGLGRNGDAPRRDLPSDDRRARCRPAWSIATVRNSISAIWFCDGFMSALRISLSGGDVSVASVSTRAVVSAQPRSIVIPFSASASPTAATYAASGSWCVTSIVAES